MGIFGSNTMSFLGGVAEGASKEIARQQSSIDSLIKDASSVIMADRLSTRKRRQTKMSDLGDKYNVLKNKGLGDTEIKLVLEQDMYSDIIKYSKLPGMTNTKLNAFVGVTSGSDVNIDKSSLLNYLTRDIVDTDLSNMQLNAGVDTLGALGLRKPIGQTVTDNANFATPKKTINIDDNLSKVSGSMSAVGQRALDTRPKTSTAQFRRQAQSVLAKRYNVELSFVLNVGTGGYDVQTPSTQSAAFQRVMKEATILTEKYDNMVFKDFSMDDSAAIRTLLYGDNQSEIPIIEDKIVNGNKVNKSYKDNKIADLSNDPVLDVSRFKDTSNVVLPTIENEIKKQLSLGASKFPVDIKAKYITFYTTEYIKKNPLAEFKDARAAAIAFVREQLEGKF